MLLMEKEKGKWKEGRRNLGKDWQAELSHHLCFDRTTDYHCQPTLKTLCPQMLFVFSFPQVLLKMNTQRRDRSLSHTTGWEAPLKQNVCVLLHPPKIHPGNAWTRCKNKWILKYRSYIQIITAWFHSPHNCCIIWKQAIWGHDKCKMSNSDCTDIHCSVAINTPYLCQWKLCACINITWTKQLRGLLLARDLLPSPSRTSGKEVLPELSFRCVWRKRSSNCEAIWGRESAWKHELSQDPTTLLWAFFSLWGRIGEDEESQWSSLQAHGNKGSHCPALLLL